GPALSYHGQMLIFVNQLQVNHAIIIMQVDSAHTSRSNPSNWYFGYVKANGIAFITDCQQ
nr:hypothetical protein [Bifidobacterium bifidum]